MLFGRDRTLLLSLTLAVLAIALVAGCGKKSDPDALVLATVGDETITVGSYKADLAATPATELPRGPEGQPLDTALPEGKMAFLESLIERAVLLQKGRQLGYDQDSDITASYDYLLSFHAVTTMHADEVDDPATHISTEELDNYYDRLSEKRRCQYLITLFRDDAEKAREEILAGEDWMAVAKNYHEGELDLRRRNEMVFESGRLRDTFEREIFALEVDEVSQPIVTTYGWWVIRLLEVVNGPAPAFPKETPEVFQSVYNLKMDLGQHDLRASVREDHDFQLDESALFIIYSNLPSEHDKAGARSKQGGAPTAFSLNIPPEDLDRTLFTYRLDDETVTVTVGDYKALFDRMNLRAQPDQGRPFGWLRQLIIREVDKSLMQHEAMKRGYHDDPRVIRKTRRITDKMIVDRVVEELVEFNDRVTPDQLEEYWEENSQIFFRPESRFGQTVACASLEDADRAYQEIRAGAPWPDVIQRYGSAGVAGLPSGRLGPVYLNSEHPLRDELFALAPRGVSAPLDVGGSWYVVQCDSIAPPYQPELKELRTTVDKWIKAQRRADAISAMVSDWRGEYEIVIYEDRLVDLPSWQQLTAEAQPAGAETAPPQ